MGDELALLVDSLRSVAGFMREAGNADDDAELGP